MRLNDLKVLELASVLAGPAVGMFFAELGAQVIKIENKTTGGDVTRAWKLPTEPEEGLSAYYCSINYGKGVQMLDLRTAADRETVHQLAKDADVVISNFKPASSERLQMDYAFLSALNPRLIYAQLTGFGPNDPRPAFDVALQAEAGYLYMCGQPDEPPSKMPVALIDLLAAHQLKEGILLALLERSKTGKGRFLQTSLLEAAIASLANQATNWLMAGHIPQRMGSLHPNIAPYGEILKTKDQKSIVLAVGTDRQFRHLCECIHREELVTDARFIHNDVRLAHRKELYAELAQSFAKWPQVELMERLMEKQVPAGRIRNMQEVFEQPLAQSMILESTMPNGQASKRVRTFTVHWE